MTLPVLTVAIFDRTSSYGASTARLLLPPPRNSAQCSRCATHIVHAHTYTRTHAHAPESLESRSQQPAQLCSCHAAVSLPCRCGRYPALHSPHSTHPNAALLQASLSPPLQPPRVLVPRITHVIARAPAANAKHAVAGADSDAQCGKMT